MPGSTRGHLGGAIHGVHQERRMMPYQSYQLYQAERVKTAAEIRRADEQIGQLAQSLSSLWCGVAGA